MGNAASIIKEAHHVPALKALYVKQLLNGEAEDITISHTAHVCIEFSL